MLVDTLTPSRDTLVRLLWTHEPGTGPDFAAFARSCERAPMEVLEARVRALNLPGVQG
jgi:hypothetical protein